MHFQKSATTQLGITQLLNQPRYTASWRLQLLDQFGDGKRPDAGLGVLGAKSKMTKHHAQEEKIAQKTGGTTQPRPDERIVTLGWFTRNRFFPLRDAARGKKKRP